MKTPEQIFKKLGNRGEYAALPSITLDEIAAIQADAREGMVPADELRPIHRFLKSMSEGLGEYGRSDYGEPTEEALKARKLLKRLETLLGEKGAK